MSNALQPLGRSLVLLGAVTLLVGLALLGAQKLPWLGRLPGDIRIEREGFAFYFPLATCLLASALASLVLWAIGKFRQ